MVRCKDDSLYTGVTTDLTRRTKEHNSINKGAKYTRNKQPVTLVFHIEKQDRSDACKYEYEIKQLTKKQKEALILQFNNQALVN